MLHRSSGSGSPDVERGMGTGPRIEPVKGRLTVVVAAAGTRTIHQIAGTLQAEIVITVHVLGTRKVPEMPEPGSPATHVGHGYHRGVGGVGGVIESAAVAVVGIPTEEAETPVGLDGGNRTTDRDPIQKGRLAGGVG